MVVKKRKSLLITFEGIDGCGKSTQALLTYQFLRSNGYKVKILREPGSTITAEKIRDLLLNKKIKMTPITELLLYEAARAEIVANEIAPALAKDIIVLCDRFYDSTTAYQGYGRKLNLRMVNTLHKIATKGVVPNLTFIFDVDLKTATSRQKGKKDRLESQPRAFFNRVRLGFLEIARKERGRVKIIDARQPIDIVFNDVKKILLKKINR